MREDEEIVSTSVAPSIISVSFFLIEHTEVCNIMFRWICQTNLEFFIYRLAIVQSYRQNRNL